MTDYFTQLYNNYEKLWNLRILKLRNAERFIKPVFHSFLGIVNPVCYLYGTKYSSTRCHTALFLRTGTIKGEAMKLNRDLLEYINKDFYKPKYAGKVTEAGLITKDTYDKKGKINKIAPGLISESRAIFFDEASNLFLLGGQYEGIRTTMNMAMDENGMGSGRVCKVLRAGEVDYPTKVTFVIGSIPLDTITNAMGEGFLERFLIAHSFISDDGLVNAKADSIDLTKIHKSDTTTIMNGIKILLNCFLYDDVPKYKKIYGIDKISALPYIEFPNEKERNEMKDEFKNYYASEIKEAFPKSSVKQQQLMDFVSRIVEKAMKIATQKAVLQTKDVVEVEDFKYGLDVCRLSLDSIKEMLMNQVIPLALVQKQNEDIKREGILLEAVRKNQMRKLEEQLGKTELAEFLNKSTTLGWDLRYIMTLKYIERKVYEGKLIEEPIILKTATGGTRKLIIKVKP
jgi:hypothetical protein